MQNTKKYFIEELQFVKIEGLWIEHIKLQAVFGWKLVYDSMIKVYFNSEK